MRYHVRFDDKINSFTVHDCMAADQVVGVHQEVISAMAHAEAEESLWKRYGPARKAAALHERKKHIPWAA